MTAHKHAALMLQYAEDATKTDTPWERWEFEVKSGVWCNLSEHPAWLENKNYRRKPQVIRVGRHEFPEPTKEEPKIGANYWIVSGYANRGYIAESFVWNGSFLDYGCLKHNMAHLSESAAQAHADVLNAICRGDID